MKLKDNLLKKLNDLPIKISEEQKKQIGDRINKAYEKPFVVSIMGLTGVGKTSLLNALFNVNFQIDDTRPCTSEPECHIEETANGQIKFWDMPGIGESESADKKYLDWYREKILESDVVLWAIHSDTRSVTYEIESIKSLLNSVPDSLRSNFISKITFIMTKADLIHPEPWIISRDYDESVIASQEKTTELLDLKSNYFKEQLINPFNDYFISKTFHDGKLKLASGKLTCDRLYAYYSGLMNESELNFLKSNHPEASAVFDRLYQNSQVIYCSSYFKFNLAKLMRVIADRIGGEASLRFSKFTDTKIMNKISWSKAKMFSNVIVFDMTSNEIIFDLTEVS